jgi:hypothetical protein
MVTFVSNEKSDSIVIKRNYTNHISVGKIELDVVSHRYEIDRLYLRFPLIIPPADECFGPTKEKDWIVVYPRIIQHTDGKYYKYVGTHSANKKYGIKGTNTVIYKEILVENGEVIEYY